MSLNPPYKGSGEADRGQVISRQPVVAGCDAPEVLQPVERALSTASGEAYRANEPDLLNWVQSTAAYGFLQAYHIYVQPLSSSERDRYYTEGVSAASLYGATGAPTSEVELQMLFHAMAGRLERSNIVLEFLTIMRSAPILPLLLRPAQDLLVRAGVDLTPNWVRTTATACILGKPRLSGRQEL